MSVFQVNYFIYCMEKGLEDYNKNICEKWDNIRDFIILHYRSKRTDTEFWKQASSNDRLTDSLKHMLDLWKTRPPVGSDYNIFSKLALGNTLSKSLYERAKNDYTRQVKELNYITRNAINNNEFYKKSLTEIV